MIAPGRPAAVTVIGEFDGLHLGHQRTLLAARDVAARHRGTVEAIVLDARWRDEEMVPAVVRCERLVELGAHRVSTLAVEEHDDPHDVVATIAERVGGLAVVSCTPRSDASGAGRRRGALLVHEVPLAALLRGRGVEVIEVDRVLDAGGEPITSRRVRAGIRAGRLDEVAELLGRRFRYRGVVQRGNQLGRTIGFPTANLAPGERGVVPPLGVYAALAHHGRTIVPAAVNVGVRPTIGDRAIPLIEAHLLDFDGDLYGATLSVEFVRWVRGERRFDGLDALTAQLQTDVETVRSILPPPERF